MIMMSMMKNRTYNDCCCVVAREKIGGNDGKSADM